MEKDYEKIRMMCKNLNITEGRTTDEFIFTIDATDLFFYKRNIGEIDVKTGFVDGALDGGIDFIYSDTETMYLIQGKSSANLTLDEIKNVFYKMTETITNFDEKRYDQYSNILKSAYLNAFDDLSDSKNMELVLFTKTALDEEMRKKLSDFEKKM